MYWVFRMNRGYSPIDDYDRESDYWRDLEDALPKEKSSSKAATEDEQLKNKVTSSISQE